VGKYSANRRLVVGPTPCVKTDARVGFTDMAPGIIELMETNPKKERLSTAGAWFATRIIRDANTGFFFGPKASSNESAMDMGRGVRIAALLRAMREGATKAATELTSRGVRSNDILMVVVSWRERESAFVKVS
jgi:hypothetical protein